SESILSLSPHGLQLETRFGFPPVHHFVLPSGLVVSTKRSFIPLPSIKDIIINEALYGWNVRYYLAVI
ncbi:hypothetical protein DL93DRAFT_2044566, partial [Clavulina sp. PMI_390]